MHGGIIPGFVAFHPQFSINHFCLPQRSKNESINSGQKISLEVVRPEKTTWPQILKLKLTGNGATESIELTADDKASTDSALRRTYSGRPLQQYVGVVHAQLEDLSSNRV